MTADAITHAELVTAAGRWLARRCSCVFSQPVAWKCWEIPDGIGWCPDGDSILVECKVSLGDLRADKYKGPRIRQYYFRGERVDWSRMGQQRYYLVPEAMAIHPKEIDPLWGLLELRGKRVFVVTNPPHTPWNAAAAREEIKLLVARWAHHSEEDWTRFCQMKAESECAENDG